MCEFSKRLIAWLDAELEPSDSKAMERHVEQCAPCRSEAERYRRISSAFIGYCDAALAQRTTTRPKFRAARPIAAATAAGIAAAFALFFWIPRSPDVPPAPKDLSPTPPAIALRTQPAAAVHPPASRRRAPKRLAATPPPSEPFVRIAIPADAVFPPGMFPDGVAILADLTLAADGSPVGLRLNLNDFERIDLP